MHRPLHDKLIVKMILPKETTNAGIYKPEQSKEMTMKAEVIAVGPGLRSAMGEYCKLDIKPGDIVQYSMHTTKTEPIRVKGEKVPYCILRESDIVAIIDPDCDVDD